MMRRMVILALCAGMAACGGGDDEKERLAEEARKAAEQTAQNMRKAAEEAPESFETAMDDIAAAFGGEAVESVPAKSLKTMLPESWPGMKRVRSSANRNGAMGFTISVAEADYESEDDDDNEKLTVKISDIGTMQGLARMGMSWINAEIDEETETGFNRTTEYKGHKAIEKYEDRGSRSTGSKLVFVDSRFLVEITTLNMPFETVDEVLDVLPVEELSKMAAAPAD